VAERCRHDLITATCATCTPPVREELVTSITNSEGTEVLIRLQWDPTTAQYATSPDNAGDRYTLEQCQTLADIPRSATVGDERRVLAVLWKRTEAGVRDKHHRLHPESYAPHPDGAAYRKTHRG